MTKNERLRVWRANNKDRVRNHNKRQRTVHAEKLARQNREYYQRNRDTVKARSRQWYVVNGHRVEVKEGYRVRLQNWRKRNPEKARLAYHNRRIRGVVSLDIIDILFRKQNGRCVYCLRDLDSVAVFELDHIMPIALGGRHEDDNLQLTCRHCNRIKSSQHPETFRESRGFL